ncbi:MAG: T9SS type A sorting domain-containing protein [Bacteroidales bacterium]|nr:T9SS type A sorting domain-containing protein [Bacteroidales bacterium]
MNLSVKPKTSNTLEIYPNPAGSFFRITGNYSEEAQIMIFDATGRLQKNQVM